MKQSLLAAGLLALALAVLTAPARALMIAAPPGPLKVAAADAVVVGKVTAVSDKAEKAELFQGDPRQMKIATLRVQSAVMGKLGTTVKVGFVVAQVAEGGRPVRPPIGGGRFNMPTLAKDQEVLLILTRHPSKKDVYVLANYYDVVPKKDNPNFKKELEEARKAVKVLTDPRAALKAKSADDRLLAAAMLITRYKTPAGRNAKTEAVPAEESKQILTILAEAEWENKPGARRDWQMSPQGLFGRLGVTAKDGWVPPRDETYLKAQRQWVKDNAEKFKMTRYVRDKVVVETSAEPDQ